MSGLRDLPRVVWVLAAGRFVSSASAFLMLFLVLYLTGPARTGGRCRPVSSPARTASAPCSGTSRAAATATGSATAASCCSRPASSASCTALIPWQPVWLLAVTMPVTGYLGAVASLGQGALAALAVPAGSTGGRPSR